MIEKIWDKIDKFAFHLNVQFCVRIGVRIPVRFATLIISSTIQNGTYFKFATIEFFKKHFFCSSLDLSAPKSKLYAHLHTDSYTDSYAKLYRMCRHSIFLSYRESYPHPIYSKSYADSYWKLYTCC
jgi:hypothetical protein